MGPDLKTRAIAEKRGKSIGRRETHGKGTTRLAGRGRGKFKERREGERKTTTKLRGNPVGRTSPSQAHICHIPRGISFLTRKGNPTTPGHMGNLTFLEKIKKPEDRDLEDLALRNVLLGSGKDRPAKLTILFRGNSCN